MKAIVGLLLASTFSSLVAGCAHDPNRPKATVAAIGNPDPNKPPSKRGQKQGVTFWVTDRAALNHTPSAIAYENRYGQPNMHECGD